MPSNAEKRSPIRTQPLPHAGQSIEKQIDDLLHDKTYPWLMVVALVVYLSAMSWVQYLLDTPDLAMCIVWTIASFVVVPIALRRVRRNKKTIDALRLGRDGERYVSQYLIEQLTPKGYRIFDDLIEHDGDKVLFNIDHVIIGATGVFVVETKTWSKPVIGAPAIGYDGSRVRIGDGPWDEWPVRQAQANADHIRKILVRSTGLDRIPIRPVVLFPGWWIEGSSSGKSVWVLELKALPTWVEREHSELPREDVALLTSRLDDHLRRQSK